MIPIIAEEFIFKNAVWAAVLIGVFLPIIGRHLILGRSILLGLAVPQISMAGIAFVFLGAALHWHWAEELGDETTRSLTGALLFGVPGLLCIAALVRGRLNEAWLAFLYLASVSVTNLMLSSDAADETYLKDLMHGQILLISDEMLARLRIALIAGAALSLLLRRRILLVLTDPDFAAVSRVRVRLWTTLLALLNGSVIAVTVAAAGPLVAFGFLILPVLTAAAFARNLRMSLWLSMLIGGATGLGGFWICYRFNFPLGDTVVATGCAVLLLSRVILLSARARGGRPK